MDTAAAAAQQQVHYPMFCSPGPIQLSLHQMYGALAASQAHSSGLQQELGRAQEAATKAQTALTNSTAAQKKLAEEAESSKQHVARLEKELGWQRVEALNYGFQSSKASLDAEREHQEVLTLLTTEKEQLEIQVESLTKQVHTLTRHSCALSAQLAAAQEATVEHQTDCQEATERLDSITRAHEGECQALRQQLAEEASARQRAANIIQTVSAQRDIAMQQRAAAEADATSWRDKYTENRDCVICADNPRNVLYSVSRACSIHAS
jgi:chromosome segregation ATPase